MSTYHSIKNYVRIAPPLPPKHKPFPDMKVNSSVIVNDPFKASIKWARRNEPEDKSRRRSRSRSRETRRKRSRSRSRNRSRRSRSKSRSRTDARHTIRERHCEDRARGERRISNMNRIKGLEKKLTHRDEENKDLKRKLAERDFQYAEMKKHAMHYKQRAASTSSVAMPYFQSNMAPFMGMQPQFHHAGIPRSVSNETIICPSSLSLAS